MDMTPDLDPRFSRYQTAWAAYQALDAQQVESGYSESATPYKQAALDPTHSAMQRAARELEAAREAYWSDRGTDSDVALDTAVASRTAAANRSETDPASS